MRIATNHIAGRIRTFVALLVALCALALYPAPRVPVASALQAGDTIAGFALSAAKGIVPGATLDHASARASDPASPDPLFLYAVIFALCHLARPQAATLGLLHVHGPAPSSQSTRGAHPPRAPPFA
ncbi:hypothetical protein [Salipiger mangrovisoli]|uniref:Uncharacterized protein n=1 Tax=Salipiger mangrovisoli TaxID=2865933 RepID=A0ABR9X9M5_9RHOB|nr:hypothetical protein [Salipiger mangrovisoli]MBE9640309.1 hypothetical protein [Salipiger mangrovisoli]